MYPKTNLDVLKIIGIVISGIILVQLLYYVIPILVAFAIAHFIMKGKT
jgi:predicted PurR-regulated permease PerM